VVGGGVNGAGIARDATSRGLTTAMRAARPCVASIVVLAFGRPLRSKLNKTFHCSDGVRRPAPTA